MDYTKNYINWIGGLTKEQFDVFVKAFIKDHFGVEDVIITDGKGDGGIDIKAFSGKKKNVPMQITIDQNVYTKLEKDLVKIEDLIENHNYQSTFYFFYSKGASEKKVIELKKTARVNHDISLEMFDQKVLASFIEKAHYTNSRAVLRSYLGKFVSEETDYFDKNQKMYFDYLSYGGQSLELKEQFIISFILQLLYNSKESSTNYLIEQIQQEFTIDVSPPYLERMIQNLLTNGRLKKNLNKTFTLSHEERESIKAIYESSELLERSFLSNLQMIIQDYCPQMEIRLVLDKLMALFRCHYTIDVNSLSNDFDNENSNSQLNDLIKYVNGHIDDKENSKIFLVKVFELCGENNFLIKLSAGNMFKDLMEDPGFINYSRTMNKEVFIDTPILISLLLVMYDKSVDYEDYRYRMCKELFETIRSGDKAAHYSTTRLYIKEVADHFRNAIELMKLVDLGILEDLGGTGNEIVNFYYYLRDEEDLQLSYEEYLEDFGLDLSKAVRENSINYLEQFLIQLFEDNDIYSIFINKYYQDIDTKSLYEGIEKTLTKIYSDNSMNRNRRSLEFDALLFTHIDCHYEEIKEPTVLTWDKTFYNFRREYHKENPQFKFWHLFSPGRYLDHLSLLKFKINGTAITREIISLIDADYDVVKNTKKVSDVLSNIIDLWSESGVKLSKGLVELQSNKIYNTNSEAEDNDQLNRDQSREAIDSFFSELNDHYINNKGKYNFKDFKDSLKNEDTIKELLKLVNSYIMKNIKKEEINLSVEFDSLISKYQKQQQTVGVL